MSKWDDQLSASAKSSSAQCPQGGHVGFGHSASLFGLQGVLGPRASSSSVCLAVVPVVVAVGQRPPSAQDVEQSEKAATDRLASNVLKRQFQ